VVTDIAGITRDGGVFANGGQFGLSSNNLVVKPSLIEQPVAGVTDTYVVTVNNAGGGTTLATISVTRGSVKIESVVVMAGNRLPIAQVGEQDAIFLNTFSVDLTPYLTDADGDPVSAVFVGAGVEAGDIVISEARITSNIVLITVSSGTGSGYIDFHVADGKETNPMIYRMIIRALSGE
jgi:hypothetical protein